MKVVLATLLVAASQAVAQDRPPDLPTRDVDVTYRSEHAGQVLEQRSRFNVANQRMRLDSPTPGLYVIVDYRTRIMSVVSTADQGVLDMKAPATLLPGGSAAGAFMRGPQDQVAGQACTEWNTRDSDGQPAETCFTSDGVMLRARRGAAVLAQAVRVAYGPIDPAVFTIPSSYNRVVKRQ